MALAKQNKIWGKMIQSLVLTLRVQNEQFSEEKGFSLRDTEKEI